jgi:PIN domain nuclease of toxin-antitoxin system
VIILDTAAWIWLTSDTGNLSDAARDAIEADGQPLVSAISAWEVGMLVSKGRIKLDRPVDRWTDEASRANGVEPVPIDHHIAVLATLLPGEPPPDPADRLIIATTLHRGGALVTSDRRIQAYPFCPTFW